MKKNYSFLLVSLVSFTLGSLKAFAGNASGKRVCVLNFERKIHPFTEIINDVFTGNRDVYLKNEAVPLDFLECVKSSVSEIVIIAHSFQIDPNGNEFRLGYFQELYAEDREEKIQQYLMQLRSQIEKLEDELSENHCLSSVVRRFRKPGIVSTFASKKQRVCSRLESTIVETKKKYTHAETLDEDYPVYGDRIFYNKIFSLAYDYLKTMKDNSQHNELKSIRLMGCTPDKIMIGHPRLKALIDDFKISLDVAPKQNLMSLIKGKDVTTMDKRWLAMSGQFDSETLEDDGFYTYLKLNTIIGYRYGSASALEGKYSLKIKGVALGLASKWSTVYIKYSDLEGMGVGERRKIVLPQLDLQVAFWANGELQLGRNSIFLGTSEINSVGASVGILQVVTIERIY